jgi:hypothetical protein
MHSWLRALPLALLFSGAARCADVEPVPGIFAPRFEAPQPAPVFRLQRTAPTSLRVSALISERVLAQAQAFDTGALPIAISRPAGESVVMEKFVVNAEKVRPIELPEEVSPLRRFVSTGRLFEKLDGKIHVTADMKLLTVRPAGALGKDDSRVEVAFGFKW